MRKLATVSAMLAAFAAFAPAQTPVTPVPTPVPPAQTPVPPATPSIQWRTDYDAGIKEANDSGKLAMIDFYADW